jgi:hypothetical protein
MVGNQRVHEPPAGATRVPRNAAGHCRQARSGWELRGCLCRQGVLRHNPTGSHQRRTSSAEPPAGPRRSATILRGSQPATGITSVRLTPITPRCLAAMSPWRHSAGTEMRPSSRAAEQVRHRTCDERIEARCSVPPPADGPLATYPQVFASACAPFHALLGSTFFAFRRLSMV